MLAMMMRSIGVRKNEDAKIKTEDPLYVGDGLFQGDEPQKMINAM